MTQPDPLAPVPPVEDDAQRQEARTRLLLLLRARSGINWFYWVGALSIINTLIFASGNQPNYFLSLALVQVVNSYSATVSAGSSVAVWMHWVAVAIDLLLAAVFIYFAYRGQRGGRRWVVVGLVLYAFDGLIFLVFNVWLGVLFHAFVIYSVLRGLRALDTLESMGPARGQAAIPPE